MSAAWVVAFAVVGTLSFATALVVLGLLRRMAAVIQGVEQQVRSGAFLGGVPTGWLIPPFEVQDGDGRSLSSALFQGPGILLMLSSDCDPCEELLEEIRGHAERPTTVALFVVLEQGDSVRIPALPGVAAYKDVTAFQVMNVTATPLAMAFDARGVVVARSVPDSVSSLRELERSFKQEVMPLLQPEGAR